MSLMRTVVFDTETGGLKFEQPTIQFSAILVDPMDWREHDSIDVKIQFDPALCDPKALEMNSYDEVVWQEEAVSPREALGQIAAFFSDHADVVKVSARNGSEYRIARCAGYNVSGFDIPRLQRGFKNYGVFWAADIYRPLDVLALAHWYFSRDVVEPEDYKLATVAAHLGIKVEGAHDALADCRMTARVAKVICEARFP